MTPSSSFQPPPTDFIAFLAERSGVSEEAAAARLLSWFGEFQRFERDPKEPSSTRRRRC